MTDTRDESGRFAQTVSDDVVLAAVRAHTPAATSEVADECGVTRQAVDYRLRELRDDGRVNSKKIGASLVWFPTDGRELGDERASERGERGSEPEPPDGWGDVPGDEPRDDEPDRPNPHREAVEALGLEGAGSRLEAREAALVDVVDYLREHGEATAGELKDRLDVDGAGYDDADSFWANLRRQDVFDTLPVETPGRGGRLYRYDAGRGDE